MAVGGDLGRLVATFEANADRFGAGLNLAAGHVSRFATSNATTMAKLSRAYDQGEAALLRYGRRAALLGGAAAAGLAAFAARQIKVLDGLKELSDQTGIGAGELRRLDSILRTTGATSEGSASALRRFAGEVAKTKSDTGALNATLEKLDPAFLQTIRGAGSTGEALRLVADRIANARSEGEKLQLAQAAFGRQMAGPFVLALSQGSEGLERFLDDLERVGVGRGFDELVVGADRLSDALVRIKDIGTDALTRGLLGDDLDRIGGVVADPQVQAGFGIFAEGIGKIGAAAFSSFELLDRMANALEEFKLKYGSAAAFGGGGGFVDAITNAALGGMSEGELAAKVTAAEGQLARARETLHQARLGGDTGRIDQLQAAVRNAEVDLTNLEGILDRLQARRRTMETPLEPRAGAAGLGTGGDAPGARATSSETQRALEQELQDRDRLRTLDYDRTLEQFRREEQLALEGAAKRTAFEEAITQEHREATFSRVAMLELERDKQLQLLDEIVGKGSAKYAELAGKIGETFDKQIDEAIVTPSERAFEEIGQFGEQVFGDMVQGWVQGADVSFQGIAQSFAAMLLKMQAEALARDLVGALTGKGGDSTSLIGQGIDFVGDILGGGGDGGAAGDAESDAQRAELAGASIATQLLESIEGGAESLVNAGRGAGGFIADSAGSIWDAGAAAARAIVNALAGSGGGGGGGGGGGFFSQLLGLAGTVIGGYFGGPAGASVGGALGGAAGGVWLAEGGFVGPDGHVEKLDALARAGGGTPIPRLGDGGVFAKIAGVALLGPLGLIPEVRHFATAGVFGGDKRARDFALMGPLGAVLGREERHALALGPLGLLAEGGSPKDSLTALVGEAGPELLLGLDQVPGILARSGGSASRAARLADQVGERITSPEIRDLVPGDLVIPNRKMRPFFADLLGSERAPSVALAQGGYVSGLGSIPLPEAMQGGMGSLGLTVKLEQQVAPGVTASPLKQSRGPSGELILQQLVARGFGRDLQVNGPMAQRFAPGGPQGGLR